MTIGTELRAYRHSQGLTLAQMGERLDVHVPYLSRMERGIVPVPVRLLRHLPERFEHLWIDDQVSRAWKSVRIAKGPQVVDN